MLVFEKMFDEDKSGQIDEDEFFFLLQYLGIEVGDQSTVFGSTRVSRSTHMSMFAGWVRCLLSMCSEVCRALNAKSRRGFSRSQHVINDFLSRTALWPTGDGELRILFGGGTRYSGPTSHTFPVSSSRHTAVAADFGTAVWCV